MMCMHTYGELQRYKVDELYNESVEDNRKKG